MRGDEPDSAEEGDLTDEGEDRAALQARFDDSRPADPPPPQPAPSPDYGHLLQEREYERGERECWVWSERLREWKYGWIRSWQQDKYGWWATVILRYAGEGYLIVHESWTASGPDEESR